jgi:hypothetical protein
MTKPVEFREGAIGVQGGREGIKRGATRFGQRLGGQARAGRTTKNFLAPEKYFNRFAILERMSSGGLRMILSVLGSGFLFLARGRVSPESYFIFWGFLAVAFGFCGFIMSIKPGFVLNRTSDDGYLDLVGAVIKNYFPEGIHRILTRFVGIGFVVIGVLLGNLSYSSYQYHNGSSPEERAWEEFLGDLDEAQHEVDAAIASGEETVDSIKLGDYLGGNQSDETESESLGTVAEADQYIAQASAQWKQADYQGALNIAQRAYKIYKERLGEQDPKTQRVVQMIKAAKQQLP